MMATPYFQERFDSVPSTQDVAREHFDSLPLLVIASAQTRGRGRSGSQWESAGRAMAASLAVRVDEGDRRPVSLMAGVAASRVADGTHLKWPNDVVNEAGKVGGILVEQSAGVTVIGLGLNLHRPGSAPGSASLYETDPGAAAHVEIASLWGAEFMELLTAEGWPKHDYKHLCSTLGQSISWEPDGEGVAVDVSRTGGLVVETREGLETIYSGAVKHVRPA